MNTVIIPDNIVNGVNTLTQRELNKLDTIYIVESDFTLGGNLTLPNGCELRIEGGSIKSGKDKGFRIYMPNNSDSYKSRNTDYYSYLTLASPATPNVDESQNKIIYTETEAVFMTDGDYIKSTADDHFEIHTTTECRVMLPGSGAPRGTLHITSDKVNSIQIDGKSNFQMHAENCRFERIFANKDGWSMVNRRKNHTDYNIFTNCDIWASDYPLNKDNNPAGSNFLTISAGVVAGEKDPDNRTSEQMNWLILRDCMVDNVGLQGTVHVENCTFLFGYNVNDNYETIHCGSHSRILNCTFDGRNSIGESPLPLSADVIDLYNAHDVVIDGCTFIAYTAKLNAEGQIVPGINMISVKSHYSSNPDSCPAGSVLSNCIGPQNGVIIRNCYFDLPDFVGYIIEPWNGVTDGPNENRQLNRQFTLIENNYIYAPNSVGFINCFGFTDYVTIRNNVGQIDMLVMAQGNYPGTDGDDKNVTHNLIIDGNILRFQDGGGNKGMTILYGSRIDNLELTNNKVYGYLWNGLDNARANNLSGIIKICNIETTGSRGLFQNYNEGPTRMPSNLTVIFSNNISKGKLTDCGTWETANDQSAGINFVGRQYFCTTSPYANKLLVFNGSSWQVV